MIVLDVVNLTIDIDGVRGLAALFAFVLFIVEVILLQAYVFDPFLKRLKGIKDDKAKKDISPELQNELYYADYLLWAAEKGHAPKIYKQDVLSLKNYNEI